MIDFRRGIARIGYALLGLWLAGWLVTIVGTEFFGAAHWSPYNLLSVMGFVVGIPLAVFWLWRLLLWILNGFVRLN
jgi:hypothetical protein